MAIKATELFLRVKDHSVSKENFDLLRDPDLELLQTVPQPQPQDLGRYYESDDYISHTDGRRSLFERVYQSVKNYSIKRKLALLETRQSVGALLDIGAGTGDFLSAAKKSGWQTFGVEPSEKAKAIAQRKGVQFVSSTVDLPDHSQDAITMWHVLEHVPDPVAQIAELKRLLKPAGTILIAVPNFKSYDAGYYGSSWAAYDVPRHLWHFSKTAIAKLFAQQGLDLIDTLPMPFDAYYVSLLSEKYKTGKMNAIRAFWIGLRSNLRAKSTKEYSSHIYVIQNA